MATGLLVLGVGPSTRLLRFARAKRSATKAWSRWALRRTLSTPTVKWWIGARYPAQREHVNLEASGMLGSQSQTPPMVSAIKVKASVFTPRTRGIVVERVPRAITVDAFSCCPRRAPTSGPLT